jgi:hypothetical protein
MEATEVNRRAAHYASLGDKGWDSLAADTYRKGWDDATNEAITAAIIAITED